MIDWDRVQSVREEIGPADFDEVVELFLEEVGEVMARLPGHPPGAALEADLHLVKGCALNLGFRRLAELCHAGERSAATGHGADIGAIVAAYRDSRDRFLAGLQQGADQIRNSPSNTSSVMSR